MASEPRNTPAYPCPSEHTPRPLVNASDASGDEYVHPPYRARREIEGGHGLTVWEESRHIARREEIMRARGERDTVGGDRRSNAQVERMNTVGIAADMGMTERTYQRRHAIGRGITEETAEVLGPPGAAPVGCA